MANTKSNSLGVGMSMAAQVAGVCYLPWYVAMLAVAIALVSELLHLNLSDLQINVCYFVINCVVVWVIFHNFLLRRYRQPLSCLPHTCLRLRHFRADILFPQGAFSPLNHLRARL